jgi:hypothetical protein
MSFVDRVLMEDMKFLCKWRTIVFYGPGNWTSLALGWLVKIRMEWNGGFASFFCNAIARTYTQHITFFFQILLLPILVVYSLPSHANFQVI